MLIVIEEGYIWYYPNYSFMSFIVVTDTTSKWC